MPEVVVTARHPIYDKIERTTSEIKSHFSNAARNIAGSGNLFGLAGILTPTASDNSLSDYWEGVKKRGGEYVDAIKGLPALADKIMEASGVEISPGKPPQNSTLNNIGRLKAFHAQLEMLNGLAAQIEELTADLKAASHGDNKAKGKLGLDVFIAVLTEAIGAYAQGVKALKSGKPTSGGLKSPYPEGYKPSRASTSQGSEMLDDAIRTMEPGHDMIVSYSADDFISGHAYDKHKYNPSVESTRNRTQYGANIDPRYIRETTINNADEIVPHFDKNGFKYATTYKKSFPYNISTNATPTNKSRVIINHSNPSKSSQFPLYR